MIASRTVAAGFDRLELGGHSLKRGALTTGMDRGVHPTKFKRLGRHKSYAVLDEYLEAGDPFEGHPLSGLFEAWIRVFVEREAERMGIAIGSDHPALP